MKFQKLFVLVVSILSISLVVFNNINQIIQSMFLPEFNLRLWLSFLITILCVIAYAVVNTNIPSRRKR